MGGEGRGPAAMLWEASSFGRRREEELRYQSNTKSQSSDWRRQAMKELATKCTGLNPVVSKMFTFSSIFEIKGKVGNIQFSMFG